MMYVFFMQYPSAATAVAYSENGQLLAVGHRNGQIQIWKGRAVSALYSTVVHHSTDMLQLFVQLY